MAPVRIQRKRTKGWKMPENAVYVGRPGMWGNPFEVTEGRTPTEAVNAYEIWLTDAGCTAGIPRKKFAILAAMDELLRGKDLLCWCPLDQPCHADILLELANKGEIS